MMDFINGLNAPQAFSIILPLIVLMLGFIGKLDSYFLDKDKDRFEHPSLYKNLWNESAWTTVGRVILTIPYSIADVFVGIIFLGMKLGSIFILFYILVRRSYVATVSFCKKAVKEYEDEKHIE